MQNTLVNQIEQALNKLNTDLANLFDGIISGDTELNTEVKNIIRKIVVQHLTNETISEIVVKSYVESRQTIYCQGTVKGDIKIDFYSQQDIIISNTVNSVVDVVMSDRAVIGIKLL